MIIMYFDAALPLLPIFEILQQGEVLNNVHSYILHLECFGGSLLLQKWH